MKPNMGMGDRIFRIFVAIITSVLYFTGVTHGTSGIILMIVGGVLLLTALVNFCPLYAIFGFRTNKKNKHA